MAKILGPYFLGIWGFINMIKQYLSYTSFGLQFSTNVALSIEAKDDPEKIKKIIGNSLILTVLISAVIIGLGLIFELLKIEIFPKYFFSKYMIFVVASVALEHLTQIFANIYRAHSSLTRIAFTEFLVCILPFSCVFIFKDEYLITGILSAMIVAEAAGLLIYWIKFPFPVKLGFDPKTSRQLTSTGLSLLIYNVSFYLIMLVSNTIVSMFYSVEEMGYFSLANRLSTASLLGLGAITWVLYPKFLWKLRDDTSREEALLIVNKITKLYASLVYLVVFGAIMLSPVLFLYLDQYKPVAPILNFLLLAQAILSSATGYNSLCIARKEHVKVTKISIITLILVGSLGLAGALLKINFEFIGLAIILGYMLDCALQVRLGGQILEVKESFWQALNKALPYNFLLPLMVIVIGNLIGNYAITGVFAFTLFITLNWRNLFISIKESTLYFSQSVVV